MPKSGKKSVAKKRTAVKKKPAKRKVVKINKPKENDLDQIIAKVKKAQIEYSTYSQEQVDEIFFHATVAANKARIILAKEAVAETGMGIVEDKVIKNHFASEFIFNKFRNEKTCGIIYSDPTEGIEKIAAPVGIIAGIVPTTNPTSTAIFKALLVLKTRNAIIFSPHPRAKNCTNHAAKIILDAAVKAGAPENIIGWIEEPTVEASQKLMQHRDVALILATGGPGMVHAAYSSGTPAIGVGSGNTPAVIDETADIPMAVSSILISKSFDNGVICASEQSLIVVDKVYDKFKKELLRQGAYILKPSERDHLRKQILVDGRVNPKIIGQSAKTIATIAKLKNVPKTARILVGEVEKIGPSEPFSYEKLSTVLAMYKAHDFEDALDKAKQLIDFGGAGHTAALYTDEMHHDRIDTFGKQIRAGRVLINMPSSQGAIGDIYNFRLEPSLMLGCGSFGGNSVSENIGPKHLLNIKTVAQRRENMLWFRVPPKIFFKRGCLSEAFKDLSCHQKAMIITDQGLFKMGVTDRITKLLESMNIRFEIFSQVKPDPDLETVHRGLKMLNEFKPDLIIAIGGGSPIDAGKIMWLMYEEPETNFDDIAMRFMDIRKRVCKLPSLGNKAYFVAIPSTSGTGSEVTPFAVITDEKAGVKYPIADYAITPNMAIIDPEFVMNMPKSLTAAGGYDAVTHALESLVSTVATEFTEPLAIEVLQILFKYLPLAYREGSENPIAREKVHYAATIAGMSFANAFLGVNHSMAHKLGSAFHVVHGVANAIFMPIVVRYNATNAPRKQGIFSQYRTPDAMRRYAMAADALELGGRTEQEKVNNLIKALIKLRKELDLPATIKEAGVNKKEFFDQLDELSELAFDDQCTGANPRYPLISEIRDMYIEAFGK